MEHKAEANDGRDWRIVDVQEYVGFPLFCCGWLSDDVLLMGGGGGQKGTGVESGIVGPRGDADSYPVVYGQSILA